jgi:hypothetical protein
MGAECLACPRKSTGFAPVQRNAIRQTLYNKIKAYGIEV